jgi:hypothetical protein
MSCFSPYPVFQDVSISKFLFYVIKLQQWQQQPQQEQGWLRNISNNNENTSMNIYLVVCGKDVLSIQVWYLWNEVVLHQHSNDHHHHLLSSQPLRNKLFLPSAWQVLIFEIDPYKNNIMKYFYFHTYVMYTQTYVINIFVMLMV